VENQVYLGIYLSGDKATVVALALQGKNYNVLASFSVSADLAQGPADPQALASLIAEKCAEKIPAYRRSEAALALDCSMFMQHNVHSEFKDPKQITSTVRFDTEEALATDISDVALAYAITSLSETGSELAVFTAQRKLLADVLLALQNIGIDPVTIEPDVNCLARFISHKISVPADVRPFFGILSARNGYFIVPVSSDAHKSLVMRTFFVPLNQDPKSRTDILAREITITNALIHSDEPVNRIEVFDSAAAVNVSRLTQKTGIQTDNISLLEPACGEPGRTAAVSPECPDPVDFALAYGAALAHLEKSQTINFRNDFMPFLGKKLRIQKALKFLSVAAAVFMVALGLYFQSRLIQQNSYRNQLWNKLKSQYSAVMLGEKPPSRADAPKKLAAELRRIKEVKSGQLSTMGEASISARLTLVLEAFNKCAKKVNLNVDSVSITASNISIEGDTASRQNTLELFEALKKGGLNVLQQRLDSKGGRDIFRITVEPKKSG
jgi:hypothetical protein